MNTQPVKVYSGHVLVFPFIMRKWEREILYQHCDRHGFHLPLWFRLWLKLRTLLVYLR